MYMDLVLVNISMIDKIHYNLMMYKYYSEFINFGEPRITTPRRWWL